MRRGKARVEGKEIDEERVFVGNDTVTLVWKITRQGKGGEEGFLVRALIRELLLGSSSRFLIQWRTWHSTPSLDEIPVNSLTRKSTAGSQSSWRAGGETVQERPMGNFHLQ